MRKEAPAFIVWPHLVILKMQSLRVLSSSCSLQCYHPSLPLEQRGSSYTFVLMEGEL